MASRALDWLRQAERDNSFPEGRRSNNAAPARVRRRSFLPLRSLSSSILKWPDAAAARDAVGIWAADIARRCPEVRSVGFFGSYARGDWGVGSDVDLLVVVDEVTDEFPRRGSLRRLNAPGARRCPCLHVRRVGACPYGSYGSPRSGGCLAAHGLACSRGVNVRAGRALRRGGCRGKNRKGARS